MEDFVSEDYSSLFSQEFQLCSLQQEQEHKEKIFTETDNLTGLKGYLGVRALTSMQKIEQFQNDLWGIRKCLSRIQIGFTDCCKLITSSTLFEYFILLVILTNTFTLALQGSSDTYLLENLEQVFLVIYTIECGMKISGMGFLLNKNSYLKDTWNFMDFAIVVSGWVQFSVDKGVNLSALRAMRMLRPLRSISSIQGMRTIIRVLLSSIKPLLSTILILVFFCFIFAVGGLQIWAGVLKYRCISIDSGMNLDQTMVCGYAECPLFHECAYTLDNPNLGATNFDNVLYGMLTVFQFVTMEGWRDVMILLQKASSPWVTLYFIPLVIIGAFFLVNLTLAVIKLKFTDTIKQEHEKTSRYNSKKNSVTVKPIVDWAGSRINTGPSRLVTPAVQQIERPQKSHKQGRKGFNTLQPSVYYQTPFQDSPTIQSQAQSFFFPQSNIQRIPLNLDNLDISVQSSFIDNTRIQINSTLDIVKQPGNLAALCNDIQLKQKILNFDDSVCFEIFIRQDNSLFQESAKDVIEKKVVLTSIISSTYQFEYVIPYNACTSSKDKEFQLQLNKTFPGLVEFDYKHSLQEVFFSVLFSAKVLIQQKKDQKRVSKFIQGEWSGVDISIDSYKYIKMCNNFYYKTRSEGWKGQVQTIRYNLKILTQSFAFNYGITLCVFLNTIVLAIDHHGISQELSTVLQNLNLAFTIVFLTEMMVKVAGQGLIGYFRDRLNWFDCLIVIISVIELMALSQNSSLTAFRTIRIFRTFKILRVARLLRYFHYMPKLIKVITRSLSISLYLALLLLIFITIFALIGMQIFGGKFNLNNSKANFDNFHQAFLATFQILSLENWNMVLYQGMRSVGPSSAVYFIVWIFIGNFVLLNLFLAILLDSFNTEKNESDGQLELSKYNKSMKSLKTWKKFAENSNKKGLLKHTYIEKMIERLKAPSSINSDEIPCSNDLFQKLHCQKSYYLFSKKNLIRIKCAKITHSAQFEKLMVIIIFVSSMKLILDTYWIDMENDSVQIKFSTSLDIVFTIIFTIEFLIKSVTMGLVLDKKSYLRDHWNKIDFSIIVFSWVDIFLINQDIQSVKVLRLFRTLRPLQFVSHNITMKLVASALINSTVKMLNVGVVVFLIWLMFAILGVSFFGGKFYSCENEELKTQKECQKFGYEWENSDSNFDNVFEAMMTLFIISSLEGWPQIMQMGVNAKEAGVAPQKGANPIAAYYFIVFVLIGSFFFMNLFIGVMFEQFEQARNNQIHLSGLILTQEQKKWVDMQVYICQAKPHLDLSKEVKNPVRKALYKISTSAKFEIFIMCCIVVNMLSMSLIYQGASQDYLTTLEIINMVLTTVFLMQALIKLAGAGIYGYFYENWNRFDFFVVLASVIQVALSLSGAEGLKILRVGPQLIRVFRIARVFKLIRIVRSLKDIQAILQTIKYSIPSMLNVVYLLILIFFIYSTLGVFIFHKVEKGEIIDQYTNFNTFLDAMLALLRISTGQEWHKIMYDCQEANYYGSYFFFISFSIITTCIMLNLFVMVVLQALDEHYENPESPLEIFNSAIKKFKKVWATYSCAFKGVKIHNRLLIDFLVDLGPPLGVSPVLRRYQIVKIITSLHLELDSSGYIFFHDLAFALLKRKFGRFKFYSNLDKIRKDLIYVQERDTRRKIQQIKMKYERDKRVYYQSREKFLRANQNESSLFLHLLTMRKVLVSWKIWKDKQKQKREAKGQITPKHTQDYYEINL